MFEVSCAKQYSVSCKVHLDTHNKIFYSIKEPNHTDQGHTTHNSIVGEHRESQSLSKLHHVPNFTTSSPTQTFALSHPVIKRRMINYKVSDKHIIFPF